MDEVCRHALPLNHGLVVGGMNVDEDNKSPQKSVRFTERDNEESSPDTHLKARQSVGEQSSASANRRRRRHRASGTSDSEMQSPDHQGMTDDYYDEEDDDSSDDEEIDQNLQQKLERIKQNLKETSA